jgi:hypothetical protein
VPIHTKEWTGELRESEREIEREREIDKRMDETQIRDTLQDYEKLPKD